MFVKNNSLVFYFFEIGLFLIVGLSINFLQKKLLEYKTNSSFVKILKVIINASYLPFILYFSFEMLCFKNECFLSYVSKSTITKIKNVNTISLILFSWMFFARFLNNINDFILKKNKEENSKIIFNVFFKILSFIAYFIMIVIFFDKIGWNVKMIIKMLGGPAIVLGFAGKEVLANCMSGLTMLINNSFGAGDFVTLLGTKIEGRVLKKGIKKTTILTLDKTTIDVPNSIFFNTPIINKSRVKNGVVKLQFFIEKKFHNKIKTICFKINKMLSEDKDVNQNLGISIFCDEMTEMLVFSMKIKVFVKTNSIEKILVIHNRLFVNILEILNSKDIISQNEK